MVQHLCYRLLQSGVTSGEGGGSQKTERERNIRTLQMPEPVSTAKKSVGALGKHTEVTFTPASLFSTLFNVASEMAFKQHVTNPVKRLL